METGKDILEKVRSIKGAGSDKEIMVEKNRATVAGAATGALIGLYYGYSKKTNMLVTTIMGALAGALVTRVFLPK